MGPDKTEKLPALKQFLKIFLPVFLLVAGASWGYYQFESKHSLRVLMIQEKFSLETQALTLKREFQHIISSLLDLSAHQQLRLIVDSSQQADYAALANEFLAFSFNRKMFDQVRLLDATGMELIRVNFNQGNPYIVPREDLQSKGDRYYFKDTFRLGPGEIFVSPFDLNIEGRILERPFKPTIRFGTPLFNSKGEKWGVLVVNYLGEQLIDYFAKSSKNLNIEGFNLLVNNDGYFLKGMRSEDEWGFMMRERKDKTFARLFPDQWDEMARSQSGQSLNDQGLFTFATYYPLQEGFKSSSGSTEVSGTSVKQLNAEQYSWKVVSFIPHESILGMTRQLRMALILSNVLFVLLGGTGIWLLAESILRHKNAENEIKRMAHFDQLTDLPNRPLLYDRLEKTMANARREKKLLSLFFLDLDGFKGINDRFGHEAGDLVLKEVARRLRQCIRETDTVARLGGDEFVLLLTSLSEPRDAGPIASKVIRLLGEPITLTANVAQSIGVSIGVAIFPKDGSTQAALLSNADAAMYSAKQKGKNTYCFAADDPALPTRDT